MHFPSALRERLIDLASSSVCPSLPGKIYKQTPAQIQENDKILTQSESVDDGYEKFHSSVPFTENINLIY